MSKDRITEEEARNIIAKPYHWIFVYDEEEQSWTGWVQEFRGCVAGADSLPDCHQYLRESAVSWILSAANSLGQTIPEPDDLLQWGMR